MSPSTEETRTNTLRNCPNGWDALMITSLVKHSSIATSVLSRHRATRQMKISSPTVTSYKKSIFRSTWRSRKNGWIPTKQNLEQSQSCTHARQWSAYGWVRNGLSITKYLRTITRSMQSFTFSKWTAQWSNPAETTRQVIWHASLTQLRSPPHCYSRVWLESSTTHSVSFWYSAFRLLPIFAALSLSNSV